ncbi:uncharacterized protein LOC134297769 [Anolis carolinensis]|uniref:uncharacterized protein LOC103279356 n=2 Tax=Anolis carolinensis TaxID=28377 RepID=UPI0004629AF8|nr:PREDICTED: uncharacterized protein LOC103281857 [Anolis carolinensis]|eukprot:XP_008122355.1 PREDICTED: uncharacterized protein LOC103281857 [Anolis carolinensis]
MENMESPDGPSSSACLSVPEVPRKKQTAMKRRAESGYRYWAYPNMSGTTGLSLPVTPMNSPKKPRESSNAKPPTRLNLLPGLYAVKNKFTEVKPDLNDQGTDRIDLKKLFPEMPRMYHADATAVLEEADEEMLCKTDYKDIERTGEEPTSGRCVHRSLLEELLKDGAAEKEVMAVDENTTDGFENITGCIQFSGDVEDLQIGDSQTMELFSMPRV